MPPKLKEKADERRPRKKKTQALVSAKPSADNHEGREMLEELYATGDMRVFLREKEKVERADISMNEDDYEYLYPSLDDPMFNPKIARHKEFYDTQYSGEVKDVESEAERICNAEFELAPHQAFVRNFLSFQTPYNSLLLYHGLGSGKTCSAISVAEEMRDYMKQVGINQRIIIVAAPNIQDNFRLQLFDERKLQETDGYWNIRACVGNKLLREINPMNVRGLPREKVVSYIKRIISNSYLFLGYIEFANYIAKKGELSPDDPDAGDAKKMAAKQARKLRNVFDNRLIIIDEVHDIRVTDDNKKKRVALELMKLVKSTDSLRLLLLSATPMYNSYKEIVWLLNLMNINDKRAPFDAKDVFDDDGDFKTDAKGNEIGRELLERKATGYVSFVRGENPYMFPFKIWPYMFSPANSLQASGMPYPQKQLNGRPVVQVLQHLQLFMTHVGDYQRIGYDFIIDDIRRRGASGLHKMPNFENMESFGYTLLQRPLEALNIVYPDDRLSSGDGDGDGDDDGDGDGERDEGSVSGPVKPRVEAKELVGKGGLQRVMQYEETVNPPFRGNFRYRDDRYGSIFAPDQIGRYSSKIKAICDSIMGSEGIVIVYSQYIDGGLVPVALALEELGFIRHGSVSSLFATPPALRISSTTYEPLVKKSGERPASYVMITGDRALSPDNLADFIATTNANNNDGSIVKVVLLSQAGGQGLDFSNVRQVHILEPWYNMNRAEQVIGRGVRSCSHKSLPFAKHNVQIFLHGTWLDGDKRGRGQERGQGRVEDSEEAADLYVYRVAEAKAVQIGQVSRVLKEIAVDCLLNMEQQNFTEANMAQTVRQSLSTGGSIEYRVGDKPYSFTCDYMETCEYKCRPVESIDKASVKMDTYNESFIEMNNERILQRVRQLFKEKYLYDKNELIASINAVRDYPLVQINSALNQLVTERSEMVTDKLGRIGRVINIDRMYMFQPVELTNKNQSLFNRRTPLQVKRSAISLPKTITIGRNTVDTVNVAGDDEGELLDRGDGKAANVSALLRRMEADYDKVFGVAGTDDGDESWYASARTVLGRLEEHDIDGATARAFVVSHIVEELMYDDILRLLNHFKAGELAGETRTYAGFVGAVYNTLNKMIIRDKGIEGLMWVKQGTRVLLACNTNETEPKWGDAESEDKADLAQQLQKLVVPLSRFNTIIGFIADFKKQEMVFKVKRMEKKRHKGARCDQAGKKDAIATLNAVLGRNEYTIENSKAIGQKGICVIEEMVLRLYQQEEKDGKVWFFPPGLASLNEVETVSI